MWELIKNMFSKIKMLKFGDSSKSQKGECINNKIEKEK